MNELTDDRIRLRAACLMPDHLHAVVSPCERDIVKWANGFKSYSTRLNWDGDGRPALWQPGFYDRRIRDEAEFRTAVEYVARNPVEAGLVADPAEWPWVGAWLEE
jgi:REP element-mobilizing transposase RayT